MEQLVGSFVAHDEQGKDYVILIFQTFTKLTSLGSTETMFVPGIKRLCDEDGLPVWRIEQGLYRLTNQVILRSHPDAP